MSEPHKDFLEHVAKRMQKIDDDGKECIARLIYAEALGKRTVALVALRDFAQICTDMGILLKETCDEYEASLIAGAAIGTC